MEIFLIVLGFIAIICGLLLSRSGSGGGLNAMSGQDIELFRKSKSRGILKYIQILLFVVGVTMIVVMFILLKTKG